jgi:predicted nucleic acid-binding protein
VSYCDPSFLIALYVEGDVFAPKAREVAGRFSRAIPLIVLTEIELMTAIHRGLGSGILSSGQHAAVVRQIGDDIADGFLVRKLLPNRELLEESLRLSRKHAPGLAVRSLDIMHVAAAMIFRTNFFASFDRRQRDLAAAAGLRLLPDSLD